jgi:phosphoadenosine phosphosulfate reductase
LSVPLPSIKLEPKLEDLIALLQTIAAEYAPAVLASSLGVEDMVLTDLICKHAPSIEIFTLDTGRLPEETYTLMQTVRQRYGRAIRTYAPDAQAIEEFVRTQGPNAFYESVQLRKSCCHIRKVEPLRRALRGKRAWITGIRRQQSLTRSDIPLSEWDSENNLQKFNPLIEWTHKEIWDYVRKFDVPYNVLHDKGYPSIGCAPCTRAISAGEDIRAGRWWWENEDAVGKECGLHQKIIGETD